MAATRKNRVAKKKQDSRGRKKATLNKQVWFRLTDVEKAQAEQEATDQGRLFSGHLRFVYLAGRKALGLDQAPTDSS